MAWLTFAVILSRRSRRKFHCSRTCQASAAGGGRRNPRILPGGRWEKTPHRNRGGFVRPPALRVLRRLRMTVVSHIESKQDHVSVLDDVILPLAAHLPGCLRAGLAAEGYVIVVSDRFGANETALEVAVNLAGCLRSLRS